MKAVNWKVVVLIAVALVGITRIPVAPDRLSVEGVNLAFALERLDPMREQPHAPGFPFFVVIARFFVFFIPRAEWTFLLISIGVSAACLVVAFKLGSAMYSLWEARAAAML